MLSAKRRRQKRLYSYHLINFLEVLNRRKFIEIDRSNGLPDGLTVDEFGDVWVALFHGGQVRHYKSDGQLRNGSWHFGS